MKNIHAITLTVFFITAFAFDAAAIRPESPALMPRGEAEIIAAAGAIVLPEEKVAGPAFSFRVGIVPGLEFAAPLGFSFRLVEYEGAGTLFMSLGIADIYLPEYKELIYRPTAALAGAFYIGKEATLRGAVDISGAEHGLKRNNHPAWLRGNLALVVDMGPTTTLAMGIAYQRIMVEGDHPPRLDRTGWAYDARISFGSVQALPFSELPLFSVHIHPNIDFIAISRIDINTDTGNRSLRVLLGVSLKR